MPHPDFAPKNQHYRVLAKRSVIAAVSAESEVGKWYRRPNVFHLTVSAMALKIADSKELEYQVKWFHHSPARDRI